MSKIIIPEGNVTSSAKDATYIKGSKWFLVLAVVALIAVPVVAVAQAPTAQAPTMSVIILPINQPVTVRCQGGDELIATVWGGGEWVLECRQYLTRAVR